MKVSIYSILFLFVLFSACGDDSQSVLEVRNQTDYQLFAGQGIIATHYFTNFDVPTLWTSHVGNSGLDDNGLGDVLANRATLESIFGEDLNFIDRVSVYAYPNDPVAYQNGELAGTEIFFLDFAEIRSKTEVQLFGNLTVLNDIITEDRMIIELRLNYRSISPSNLDVRLNMEFSVFEK